MKKCPFCEKTFRRNLGKHLSKNHQNELNNYIKSYAPDPKKCELCSNIIEPKIEFLESGEIIFNFPMDGVCRKAPCKSKTLNPLSKEYLKLVKKLSDQEIKNFISKKNNKSGKTRVINGTFAGDNNPLSKKSVMARKNITEKEAQIFFDKKSKKSGETIRRNGSLKGDKNPGSKKFLVKRGMTEKEAEQKQKERNRFTVDYWLKHGYSLEEAKQKSKESCSFTKDFYREKFGNEGLLKFKWDYQLKNSENPEQYLKNRKRCLEEISGASKASLKYFIPLYKKLRKLGLGRRDIMLGVTGSQEYFIRDEKIYFYDFYIKPLNLIIEYNGSHVHASDRTPDDWHHAYSKKTKSEIIEIEKLKESAAQKAGKKVIYLWSDLCYNDNIQTIQKELEKHGLRI